MDRIKDAVTWGCIILVIVVGIVIFNAYLP